MHSNIDLLTLLGVAPIALLGLLWAFSVSVVSIADPSLKTWPALKAGWHRAFAAASNSALALTIAALLAFAWCVLLLTAVARGWLRVVPFE